MKKQLSLILCLVMLISLVFTGCGATTIVGVWKGTIDMTDMLTEQISGADESMAEYFSFDGIALDVNMTFNEDGTCSMAFNEEDVQKMMEKLIEQMLPVMSAMIEDLSGMSFADFLTISELTEEEFNTSLKEEIMNSFDVSELNTQGNYKAEDGKLYITDDLDEQVDENTTCNPYTLSGNTLTIEAGEGEEDFEFMFPLTLKKVG